MPKRPIVVAFADHLPSVAASALEPDSNRGLRRSRVDGYRWLSYDRLFGAGYSNGVCNPT